MPRPIILGVVGDSAAGKTTITRGLVRGLGEDAVTHVCTDDYHKYDRAQRAELGITPLNPDCNYIDIMEQHLLLLGRGEAILKPVYGHTDGKFGPPRYVKPKSFTVVEGLLGYHTEEMRNVCDVRVYLAPPEELRRRWKVNRDCSRRGYTTDQVLAELDKREDDSVSFIRPQERYADLVVSFTASSDRNPDHLDAKLTLRDGLPHPDLSPFTDSDGGITLREQDGELLRQARASLGDEPASMEMGWQGRQPRLVKPDGLIAVRDSEFGPLDADLIGMSVDVELKGESVEVYYNRAMRARFNIETGEAQPLDE